VLNLLRGLNSRFANTVDIIANMSLLPNFESATNMLRVKELCLGTEGKEASTSSLAASTTSSCTSSSCQTTSSTPTNRGGGGKGKGGKGKGGRNGNGSCGGRNQQQGGGFGGRQAPQPASPWVCYNPWAVQWPSHQQ
jgi:hypothetical protein